MYYNKEGHKISVEEWAKLFGDMKYRRIGLTHFEDGSYISTVWLGLDHSFNNTFSGPDQFEHLIFESMYFSATPNDPEDNDMDRYSTLEEAEAGHEKMVKKHSPTKSKRLWKFLKSLLPYPVSKPW